MPSQSITPLRARRIVLFALLLAVTVALIFFLPRLLNRPIYVDTVGDIVYASDKGSPGRFHLFLIRADGTGAKQLTRGNYSDTQPSFSPDGTQVAFVSDRGGSPQVYVMSASGLGARAISLGSDQKLAPQFSSDAQSVGYISRGQLLVTSVIDGHTTLVLPTSQNVSSSSTQNLAGAARAPVIAFAWCPATDSADRYKIAAVQQSPDNDLQTVTLVDTGNASAHPAILAGATLASVAWSRDGQQLAIAMIGASGPDGQPQNVSGIADFKADGTQAFPGAIAAIASGTNGGQNPTFSPSGAKMLFGIISLSKLNTPQPFGIAFTVAQPNSRVQVIVKIPAHNPELSRDGANFLFLAPITSSSSSQGLFIGTPTTGQVNALSGPDETVSSAQWSYAAPKEK